MLAFWAGGASGIESTESPFKDTWFPDDIRQEEHDGNYQLRYVPPTNAERIKTLAQADIYLDDGEMIDEEEFIVLMALTIH